jgi:hypothetical protein
MDKNELVKLVKRLMSGNFQTDEEGSKQIVELALNYKPIQLPGNVDTFNS